MADARLPERYLVDRRVLRLTDAERSSLFMATVWSVSNRTDGRIERADLALIPTFAPGAIAALVKAELLRADGANAWVIVDYERDQTSRHDFEVLEAARRRDRLKKQRQRSRPDGQSQGHVPGDDTGKDRTGKDRQEQGKDDGGELDTSTGELKPWPVALPGAGKCEHGIRVGAWCDDCGGAAEKRGAA